MVRRRLTACIDREKYECVSLATPCWLVSCDVAMRDKSFGGIYPMMNSREERWATFTGVEQGYVILITAFQRCLQTCIDMENTGNQNLEFTTLENLSMFVSQCKGRQGL